MKRFGNAGKRSARNWHLFTWKKVWPWRWSGSR